MRALAFVWGFGLARAAAELAARQDVVDNPEPDPPFTCHFLRQKQLGLCDDPTATVDQASVITTTIVEGEVTSTAVVIVGGPITVPVTLPNPQPTPLDPAGEEVKQSVSDIATSVSAALPAVTEWINNPVPDQATPAIDIIQPIIPQIADLINNLPDSSLNLECQNLEPSPEPSNLAQDLNELVCFLIGLMDGLREGASTEDPAVIGPIVEEVKTDSDKVNSEIGVIVGTVSPPDEELPPVEEPPPDTEVPDQPETTEAPVILTTIPPEAEFVTLTDATQTEPEYITTTREGSDDETIVPIIIPFSGPPIVCFNCFPSFPPNIKIDVPEFCIELFGIKIGKCPADDNNEEEGGEEEGGEEEGGEDEGDEEDCTTSLTATYVSVFCTVTETVHQQRRQEPTEDCSSLAWTTVTDCSVTNSETTTTTTTTATQAVPTQPLCELGTCGGGSCPVPLAKRSLDNSTTELLEKRGEPSEGDPAGPEDYSDDVRKFVAGEVFFNYYGDFLNEVGKIVKLPGADLGMITTSNFLTFGDKVDQLAVAGLYGCTSIIVVSRLGAFASHIWEPNFNPGSTTFQQRAINDIHRGKGDDEFHPFGLDELRNKPDAKPRGVIFGDNSPNGNNDLDIHVYIMTPRPRMPEFQLDVNGMLMIGPDGLFVRVPDAIRMDENANAGQQLYSDRVTDIANDLSVTFGANVPIEVVDYAPNVLPGEYLDRMAFASIDPARAAEYAELEAGSRDALGDKDQSNPRGKALIQYRPAHSCKDKAGWRIWFEGRGIQGREATWDPLPGQIFQADGVAKRQSCPANPNGDPGDNNEEGQPDPEEEEGPGNQEGPGGEGGQGIQWECHPYIGDREGRQCSCEPTGCEFGVGDCIAKLAIKGQDGCDDECNGCNIPSSPKPEPQPEPEPEPEPEPQPEPVPEPQPTSPPLCSSLELGPITGSNVVVGTGCEGYPPDERVTYTVNNKRAVPTASLG